MDVPGSGGRGTEEHSGSPTHTARSGEVHAPKETLRSLPAGKVAVMLIRSHRAGPGFRSVDLCTHTAFPGFSCVPCRWVLRERGQKPPVYRLFERLSFERDQACLRVGLRHARTVEKSYTRGRFATP